MTEDDAPAPGLPARWQAERGPAEPGSAEGPLGGVTSRERKDVAGDDFLFHLYRGSELLQDNRVHEAKQELEQALSLQPRDSKGQDLLAIVYFRLGLYPRAISIYESLIVNHPHSATPRVNLALCYLKTGQASGARAELERVLELSPRHSRAWGYLGLAFQRLGDYERAYQAFATGGHDAMARRLMEMVGVSPRDVERAAQTDAARDLVGQAASQALDRMDKSSSGPGDFRTDRDQAEGTSTSGTWAAVEPGRDTRPEPYGKSLTPSLLPSLAPSDSLLPPAVHLSVHARTDIADISLPRPPGPAHFDDAIAPPVPEERTDPSASGGAGLRPSAAPRPTDRFPSIVPHLDPPEQPETFARKLLLLFPRLHRAAQHPSGLVVMKVSDACGVRFDMVRAISFPSGMQTRLLSRRVRGKDIDEPFGGTTSQLLEIAGSGELVLGPSVGTRLHVLALASEPLSIRESSVAAFDASVFYESGKLATSEGDAVPLVQLRSAWAFSSEDGAALPASGSSVVVLSLPPTVASLEVTETKPTLVRAHSVLGWTGRITPRNLPPSEAPGKARGFIALSGEGMVFVDGR